MPSADDLVSGPLAGRTVVVTRALQQAPALADRLSALGAEVVVVPVIEVVDAADGGAMLQAVVASLTDADWLVVTSGNGAERVVAAARSAGIEPGSLPGKVAAIGPGTTEVLTAAGVAVDLVPDRFVAEGLLDAFPAPPSDGRGHVVLAQADGARPVLREGLAAAGWVVVGVEAYRTVHPPVDAELVSRAAAADAITFTSASTVRGYVAAAGVGAVPPVVASIGPITSDAVRAAGLEVAVEAAEHTIPGLVDALAAHLARLNP